jgi:hypothetical protein
LQKILSTAEERMRHVLPVVSCLVFAAPALAQTVDDAGAKRLAEDLSRYVGQTALSSGVLKVDIDGNAYRIVLDFKALTDLIAPVDPGARVEISPFSLRAKPMADGNWQVASDNLPAGLIDVDTPNGRQSVQWSIAGGAFEGVWDPAIATFRTMSGSQSSMTMTSREGGQEVHATIGNGSFALAGVAAPGGGVNFAVSEVFSDFVETIQVAEPSSGLDFPVTVRAENFSVNASADGYRTRALLDLLAFVVANADEARIKANQAELKSKLAALLPVWNRIDGAYRFGDLTAETPMGAFGASKFAVGFGMDGAVPDGSLTYSMSLTGVKVPEQIVPPWSVPLLPTEMDVSVSGVGFHADAIARKLLDNLDLNRDPPIPAAVGEEIAAEFMANPPKVVIARSTVRNRDTEVSAEGEVTFLAGQPQANVAFEVTGYDKVVEGVQEAAKQQPELGQALAVALAAKGFAKNLPDGRLRWELMVKSDGSIAVNGVQVKGPDPQ